MSKQSISLISIMLFFVMAGTMLASCGSSSSPATATTSSGGSSSSPATATTSSGSSASNGQTLMQQRCSVCHSTGRITSVHKTADQWKTTVDRMINNGAQLTPQEEQTLIDYLAQNYK